MQHLPINITWHCGLIMLLDGTIQRLVRRNDRLQVCEVYYPDGQVTKAETDIHGNFIPIDRAE